MSFVDQMTGAWIERQHSIAAQRESADTLAGWMDYARKLEAKIANQQLTITALGEQLTVTTRQRASWEETAVRYLGRAEDLRAELEAVKGAGG
jgi:uncharacterized coiled-coil protein SlyX